jgi:hypothetical protein
LSVCRREDDRVPCTWPWSVALRPTSGPALPRVHRQVGLRRVGGSPVLCLDACLRPAARRLSPTASLFSIPRFRTRPRSLCLLSSALVSERPDWLRRSPLVLHFPPSPGQSALAFLLHQARGRVLKLVLSRSRSPSLALLSPRLLGSRKHFQLGTPFANSSSSSPALASSARPQTLRPKPLHSRSQP